VETWRQIERHARHGHTSHVTRSSLLALVYKPKKKKNCVCSMVHGTYVRTHRHGHGRTEAPRTAGGGNGIEAHPHALAHMCHMSMSIIPHVHSVLDPNHNPRQSESDSTI